jgi:hypothetical protein
MIVLAVALIALSILFLLTSLALHACGRLQHPFLVLLALVGTLVLGLGFAMD